MREYLNRKDTIIFSAIDIIDKLGFQGLSTKELASKEGISEAALYRHFKSKNEIIEGVLDYYSRFDDLIYISSKEKDVSTLEKIKSFEMSYIEYYENYPAITAIMHSYELLCHGDETKKNVKSIYQNRKKKLKDLIEEGQDKGEINTILTSEEMAMLIIAYLRTLVLEWRLDECKFSIKDRFTETFEKLLIIFEGKKQ